MESFLKALVACSVVVDPVGTSLVFNAPTGGNDEPYSRKMASRDVVLSTGLVLFFGFLFSKALVRLVGQTINNVFKRPLVVLLASLAIRFVAHGIKGPWG
ncbi:MAG: hypothetical protein RRA32_03735 [bacterium]|nr:hypothetical protein [bacterium]